MEHSNPTSRLVDSQGSLIIPSPVPPRTTFPHTPAGGESETAARTAETAHPNQSVDYFKQHNGPRAVAPTDQDDKTAIPASNGQSAPTRPAIDRLWQTERPAPAARRSTLTAALKRRITAGSATHDEQPCPYPVDESNSDGLTSSDEEGANKQAKRDSRRRDSDHDYSRLKVGNGSYKSKARVSRRDGRLNISVNETSNNGYIAKAMGHTLGHHFVPPRQGGNRAHHNNMAREMARYEKHHHKSKKEDKLDDVDAPASAPSMHETIRRPRLNIVIMVIGSRGDIQPFMQIGRKLKEYGHRVRIATHPAFKEFVEKDVGLEFFSVGGNPSELMAFMVKNPGLIPKVETIRQGEIARRRNQMAEMFEGFWRACTNSSDDEKNKQNKHLLDNKGPFIADAIIANPPSFAHVHIAERLGIPLHIMFTFPYTPTQAFPHPLANIKPQKTNVDENYVNFMSYPLVEMMTWQGLGDLVNRFRVKTLGLEPVSSLWAPGALFRMKVPYTYMWSPALVPKPKDWGPEIDIGGYVFLDLASDYTPPDDLKKFLDDGEPPIYIGFGSIVVDDPDQFTKMIFEAVEKAGVRALVSKGWGGLGGDNTPDNIFMLENTPHDWLFPRCKAVVHHGGAGTCAIGLKCAKPTMIVPFFGDQPFWGAMVSGHKAGAHESIPYKDLNSDKLAEGIKQCLTEEAQENIQKLADQIAEEGDGAENAVKSFLRSLPFAGKHNMRCSILEDRVAVWQLKRSSLRLSALAAEILVADEKLRWDQLRLLRVYEWNDFDGPGEPISGIGGVLVDTSADLARGVGMVPVRMAKHIKKYEKRENKKKERAQRKEEKERNKLLAKQNNGKQKADSSKGESNGEIGQLESERQSRLAAPSHQDTSRSIISTTTADPEEPLAQELATDAGNGLLTSFGAIASLPLDLALALAQGFHNAPRLYGDASVRKPVRITGFHSGAKAARNEFAFGVYDGFTGIVKHPVHGWQDAPSTVGKISGVAQGLAKGLGGFVLKDVTAIIAPPTMLCQGVRKELKKRLGGPGTAAHIRQAHMSQGRLDLEALQAADKNDGRHDVEKTREAVEKGWSVMNEVWTRRESHQQQHGGKIRGRLSVHKEERSWNENGALENIGATERALEAHKQGKDVSEVFAQRRIEMEIASQPRASAMDQPVEYEKGAGVAPNGHYKHDPRDSPSMTPDQAVEASGQRKEVQETSTKANKMTSDEVHNAMPEDEAEDTSDTAVESQEEDNGTSDVKAPTATRGDFKTSPAGRLNDVEIGKHHADRIAGRTAVAA